MKMVFSLGSAVFAIAVASTSSATADNGYTITTVTGFAHGPGPMPATPILYGRFTNVNVDAKLTGESPFFNNGPAEPNHTGAFKIFGGQRSTLSNGIPFNEHVDGGVITIGQGALHMMAGIPANGPNQGAEYYRVDERLNWCWKTDVALDAGFEPGLTVSKNLNIKSGVIWVLPSLQTEAASPGGFDRAGEIPSGAPVVGRVGDQDNDGFVDATMVGVGRVPLNFIFVPGAPLVMMRSVVTNIPVAPRVSGILELAGIGNLTLMLKPVTTLKSGSAVEKYYVHTLPQWATEFAQRAQRAAAQLQKIAAPEAKLAQIVATDLTAALDNQGSVVAYTHKVMPTLERLEAALPQLRAVFDVETRITQHKT